MKRYKDLWLPDREDYLIRDIDVSEPHHGMATVQFKKLKTALPQIKRRRHAVDVGANLGIWTRTLSHLFDRVTCFEPAAECREAFWLNNTRGNVTLHEVALGSVDGIVTLSSHRQSTALTRVQSPIVRDHEEVAAGSVPVKRLDAFDLQDVDLIKIDVEGWEWHVVHGGEQTIRRWRPTMIIEQKPRNAERYGIGQFAATAVLQRWGARVYANMGGDVIMVW